MHDVCAAIHPLGVASPFFRGLPLADHGLEWVFPPAAIAHPLDDGSAILVQRSVAATAAQLGVDAAAYRRLMGPLAADWRNVLGEMLGPLRFPRASPQHGAFRRCRPCCPPRPWPSCSFAANAPAPSSRAWRSMP